MENTYFVAKFSEAYSESSQRTKTEHFVEIVNSFEPLTIFTENSILDVWLGYEYNSSSVSQLLKY